mmetsp:Transcript_7036/g.21429  ORF Transcript_7036/g.21429 Transcript_7036/m.21429 type:complete len:287 (-) Transcript_7036:347-1207(-)
MGRAATVFVGNIPYDTTEEQLRDIFSQVGVVSSFRLVYDSKTGKPRGYGFCEYEDAETARSALRNLDSVEVNGRPLRVALAEHDNPRPSDQSGQSAGQNAGSGPVAGVGGLDHSSSRGQPTLERLSPEQIHEMMILMRQLIERNAKEVQLLLLGDPNLTYALLQGQILLGLVPPGVMSAAAPAPVAPVGSTSPSVGVTPPLAAPGQVSQTASAPAGDEGALLQQLMSQIGPGQDEQLKMVMNLTPAEISQLPPNNQQEILQLQRTLRMAQMGGTGQPARGSGPGYS